MCPKAAFGLVLIGLIVGGSGCGDDDSPTGQAEVALGEPTAVAIESGDPEANREPGGQSVLRELPELRRAEGAPDIPAIRGSQGLSLPEWLDAVNADAARYWQRAFNAAGYRYVPASQIIFTKQVAVPSGCGGSARPGEGPFYCQADEAIYLPVQWFAKQARRFGDAGVAVVVAHENGHRVQDLLGIFGANLLTIQEELQADCLAGVWAASVYRRGLLEPGDVAEVLGQVRVSGDPSGVPVTDPGAHGDSRLRRKFYLRGYGGGKGGACRVPKVGRA